MNSYHSNIETSGGAHCADTFAKVTAKGKPASAMDIFRPHPLSNEAWQ
ncbi:hypothetical protein F4827_003562 [Paraburkholderia bannensis]|uniref:Uncharacterized protein n=1 Tax=Paraburkholderia bannensis TaxID=765414 RepID=A0A7W9WTU4_9BURK|nr:hypothetical protein [Paraburkholderia sp. WP4_3_2]MBB6103707.1 hypothetical protein [Paraburkholderia bannensis]